MLLEDPAALRWPAHDGETARLMRAIDWRNHPLGPSRHWPASLRTAIELILPSQAQLLIFWGPQLFAFYNDAYAPTIGRKHPAGIGAPARQAWAEVWDDLGPLLRRVLEDGETVAAKDRPFKFNRHGYLEDVFFDISYSPIRGDGGEVAGVLCIVDETTARVLAARALADGEAQLRAASERIELALNAGAVIGTWVWDIPSDRLTADERFARAFALTADQLARGIPLAHVKQSIHPDDSGRVSAAIEQAMARGGPYSAEYRVRQHDGSWLWIEANGRVELDAQGAPVRFPGVLIDIDRRKRGEQSRQADLDALRQVEGDLKESLTQLRLAQAAGGIGVFRIDIASNEMLVSEEFCRLFGLPVSPRLDGAALEALVEVGKVSSHSSRSDGTAPLNVQYQIRTADTGQLRWLSRRAEYERDAQGRPVAMRGVVQDITQQKAAQDTLRESEASFRALAQALPNQVWTARPDGMLDWFNQRILDYSGMTPQQLDGQGWGQIVHSADIGRVVAIWQAALAAQSPYEAEFRIRRHDGVYRWHLVRAVPVESSRPGQALRWVGTNTDIDDHKAAQAALAGLNANLEQRVEERTRDLQETEARLRQSQKMEALGQLTGGIAHDFNNLLQGITGSIEVVRMRMKLGRTDDIDRYMQSAVQSAHRAAALVHRLLAFARRQSLDTQPVDVNTLVVSMEDLLRRTLGENISLKVQPGPQAWLALCDENQLESAILNLAINARDAMPRGGRLVISTGNATLDADAVRGYEGLAPGDFATVTVSDNGDGMPADVLARVFEPFFTTKPVGQGTGLGLSMIYGFAKQSGGHVRLTSEPRLGTTATLYLPRHAALHGQVMPAAGNEAPQGSGEVVLVVEDDGNVRQLVVEVLHELGYGVIEAVDASAALPHLQGPGRIDLLVSDVGLPGMNGRQLAELARQHRPQLRVLLMTGYAAGATSRGEFLGPGMEMISKPFAISALAVKVQQIIESQESRASARS